MNYEDMFKPYSLERNGDLLKYLQAKDDSGTDNHFFGAEYWSQIVDCGLIIPKFTTVRVNKSPVPDIGYIVNEENMLVSNGGGKRNMSLVGAKEGVYDPQKILDRENWSISNLNL